MPFTYRQVKDLYDRLRSAGATQVSLPEWSEEMNQLTGTDLYGEGRNDNLLKQASVGIDRALESVPGLTEGATALGRRAGALVGDEEAGARVGATLPRMTANMLPYLIPGAGWGAGAARLGGAALMAGMDAYTQTGSPASGLVSGAIAAALPKGTDIIEQAILKKMGVQPLVGPVATQLDPLVTKQVSRLFPETTAQRVASFGGGQLAASGMIEGQRWGEELFSGQPLHSPFTTENLLNLTLGQLPFAGIHGVSKLAGVRDPATQTREAIAHTEKLMEQKRAQDALAEQTDIEKIPIVEPAWTQEQIDTLVNRRSELRSQQEKLLAQESLTPEDAQKLNDAVVADNALPTRATPTSALGAEQGGEHVSVLGKQLHETAKWRKILVSDDPSNPEELRGKVVEYSKGLREPVPMAEGEATRFGVTSDPLWRTLRSAEDEANRQLAYAESRKRGVTGSPDAVTPELPEQATPAADYFSHISDLDRVEVEVDAARTPAQLQKAILGLRKMQESAGLSDFNDAQLQRVMKKMLEKGEKSSDVPKKAIKARMDRDRRMLEAQQAKETKTRLAEDWFAEEEAKGEQGNIALLNEFKTFAQSVEKRGNRGATLASSGQLTEMLHALRDDPDAMSRLKTQVDEVLRTGKGLTKPRPVLDEEKQAIVDNPDSEPRRNVLAESTLQAIQNKTAQKAFDSWERKADTNWDYEKRTFVDWVDEFGPPGKEDIVDAAEFFADRDGVDVTEMKDELNDFLDRPHVKVWLDTLEGLTKERKAHAPQPQQIHPNFGRAPRQRGALAIGEIVDRSKNPILGALQGKLVRNSEGQIVVLGGRDIKPGLMDRKEFLSRTTISPKLIPLFRKHYPEAFVGDRVDPTKLVKGLEERPLTEVMKAGEAGSMSGNRPFNDVQHDLVNAGYNYARNPASDELVGVYHAVSGEDFMANSDKFAKLPEQVRRLFEELKKADAANGLSYSPHYSISSNPKGGTEIAVVAKGAQGEALPSDAHHDVPGLLGTATVEEKTLGELRSVMGKDNPKLARFADKPDDAIIGVQTEAQSDWESEVRDAQEKADEFDKREAAAGRAPLKHYFKTPSHPLLPYWERLVADAVIQHGLERGWEGVVVTDAKTAAMTEGHDAGTSRQIPHGVYDAPTLKGLKVTGWDEKPFAELNGKMRIGEAVVEIQTTDGKWVKDSDFQSHASELRGAWQDVQQKHSKVEMPKEFPGHAQHYGDPDFRIGPEETPGSLQQEFAKATGEENTLRKGGANVLAVGVHKGAGEDNGYLERFATREQAQAFLDKEPVQTGLSIVDRGEQYQGDRFSVQETTLRGSPSLTEPHPITGVVGPKVYATGNFYSFDRLRQKLSADSTLPFKEATRFAPQSRAPRVYASDVPAQQEVITKLTTDGHGIVRELLLDNDPQVKAIAADLVARFPEALSRIDSGVYEVPGSYAARRPSNRVGLFFDRSLASMSPFTRNSVALHELIHGLTLHELANPKVRPEVVAELTALRERLIEALPKSLRSAYDKAIDSDWYNRFTVGAADMDELHPNPNFRQVLYGLLNNDELAAQGFSSRSMKEFMQSVGGKKQNGWKTFTGWVKNLLGLGEKIDGTAFGDFLSTTSALMTHGEWLADFGNFGERYFEAQGKGGAYGRAQTDRALGLVADSAFGLHEPLTLVTSLDLSASKNTANPELRKAKRSYEGLLRDSPEDKLYIESVLGELGHKDIDAMVTSAIGEGQDVSSALDMLPPEATNYVYARLRDAQDVLDVIRAASSEKNKGMTNLADPKLLRSSVAPVLKQIKRALAHEEFANQMATDLAGLSSVAPEGLLDAAPRFAPKILEDFFGAVKGVTDKAFNNLSWALEPPPQWARRVPEVAEAVSKGRQIASNIRKMHHEGVKWLGMDTSNPYVDAFTQESVDQTNRVMESPKLSDAVGQYMFWNQEKNREAVTILSENDADIAKVLSKLSDKDRKDVVDVVNKASKVTQMMNVQKLEKMNQIASVNGAGVIAYKSGLKTRDNVALAAETLKGIQLMADPMTSNEGLLMLQGVQQRLADPTAFTDLFDYLKLEAEQIKNAKTYFDANPAWATAQSQEQFVFWYLNKAGKRTRHQASSENEMRDYIAKKGGKFLEVKDNHKGRDDEPFAFPNMSPEMAQRMQEIEANQIAMLQKAGVLDSTNIEEFRKTSAVSQILVESQQAHKLPGVQVEPRKLGQGAEELPWLYNHVAWAERESRYWSRALLRAQQRTYLKDIEIRDNPEHVEKLKTHFGNLLRNDPTTAHNINRFVSTWFLGFNPANVIINAAQPFTSHVAELTRLNGGKMIDSYQRMLRAHEEARNLKFGRERFANEEHRWLHGEATKDGQINMSMYDDDAAAQESISYKFKRLMKKEAPKTLGQRLSTLADNYATASMWMFRGGEQLNAETALFASYDLYREQGFSKQEAKQKAYEFNGVVNYNEGRNQRGIGAFSSKSPTLRGVAMLGTSLQSYVLGTTSQIIRYLQQGFFRPNGLTPHEIHAARRAALQMLATQFAAAGVLGMPFVSGAIALLDKAFPELELNRKTRERVNDFLSQDKENGSVLTDIAMTGMPSALGWDMQSRLSMGNTLPGVSEVNGFQPENLMGPAANIVKNFVNGTAGWVKGDAKAGLNFLPPAVRKLIEAGRATLSSGQVGGGIQDYQGRPLAAPTRGEYAGALLGFQPKRLSDQNAAARVLRQSEEVLRTQESRFRQQQAEEALKGNFGNIRQELRARKQTEESYDDVAAVQAIARASEELAFPRDLRSEGTARGAKVRSELLSTYQGDGNKASEVVRLQFRKNIEQRLGLQGDMRNELKLAMLMDQLRLQHPEATRLELKSAALEATRRSRSRELAPVSEF